MATRVYRGGMTKNRFEESPLERVTWWAEEATAAHGERNNAIRDAVAAGHTLREVGAAAGLTHMAISYIVKPRKAR